MEKKSGFLALSGMAMLVEIVVFFLALVIFTVFAMNSMGLAYAVALAVLAMIAFGIYRYRRRTRVSTRN